MSKELKDMSFSEAIARFGQTKPQEARELALDDTNKKQYGLFEDHVQNEDGIEFWYARDLMGLLGYSKWENFLTAMKKAAEACETSNINPREHWLPDVRKSISGKGRETETTDYRLTRYACYLIAQNADPKKDAVAFAQTYFAVQTRAMEVIQKRLAEGKRLEARDKLKETERKLSAIAPQRGVDKFGFLLHEKQG